MRRGFPSETRITCKKEGKIYVEPSILRPLSMSRDIQKPWIVCPHFTGMGNIDFAEARHML